MDQKEALQLAAKIASGRYSQDELDRFLSFMETTDSEQASQLLDVYKKTLDKLDRKDLLVAPDFMNRLRSLRPESKKKISWLKYVSVAASILLVFGTYFYFSNKNEKASAIAQAPTDIKAPQTNRATITLASGQNIFLDSASNGQLALQNNVKLNKTAEGTISYDGSFQLKSTALIYNTLTNPKGSRVINMMLTDGTKVWLNAGSSLTYPVTFTGKERNVEITGEAYFEVSHNPSMPFIVKKSNSDTKIQVLGTHFNVNAYEDEASIKVTLLEGAVNVTTKSNIRRLSPGEQALVHEGKIAINKNVDTDEVMAWTTGFFQFNQLDLQSIMRQIARWYDLEITYESQTKSDRFGGRLSKDLPLSVILKSLEANGNGVKFRLEGKKLYVQ